MPDGPVVDDEASVQPSSGDTHSNDFVSVRACVRACVRVEAWHECTTCVCVCVCAGGGGAGTSVPLVYLWGERSHVHTPASLQQWTGDSFACAAFTMFCLRS